MKKLWVLLLGLTITFTLQACAEQVSEEPGDVTLDIYYLNDLHGAVLPQENQMGLANLGNFLLSQRANNPDSTLVLGGGDMVQGTLISNYFYGENTTRLMDEVGFDATVIGNHEFDWGLEKVTRYYDGTEGVYQAEHLMLGANVFYQGTEDIPSGITPTMTIEKSGYEIGIIGTMGYGLESSILAPMVEGYEFADPVPIVEEHARRLREEGADVVLLISHDGGDYLNPRVLNLPEDAKVDAIFNGHSHRNSANLVNNTPVLISGSSGSHVGHVELMIRDGEVYHATAQNLTANDDHRLREPSPSIAAIIESSLLEIEQLYEGVMPTSRSVSRDELTVWMSELMMLATDADFGFQNSGGTRDSFYAGESVSVARLYDVFPFDNTVVVADVPGYLVERLMDFNSGYAAKGSSDVDPSETYRIATNNYIFYHPSNDLVANSENTMVLELEMFDLAVEALERMAAVYDAFDTDHPHLMTYYETWYDSAITP